MTPSAQSIRFAITQIAADWYMAHRAGSLSQADREEFLAWLKASPIHLEEYLGVAALERALPEAAKNPPVSLATLIESAHDDEDSRIVELISRPSHVRFTPRRARTAWRLWWGIAALVSLSVAGFYVLGMREEPAFGPQTYTTAHGVQATWRLPDGSTLHLDTDTAVTVRLSSKERLLVVDRGQIAIAVEHDVHRPFRVHAGSIDTIAVGTEFDVYRRSDSTVIIVMSGLVDVSAAEPLQPRAPGDTLNRTLRLGAGQQVRVINGVIPLGPTTVNRREATAWLDRKIIFEHRPLGDVTEEFNRYNAISFTIDDTALRNMPISGAFDANDIESFAAYLESLDGVHVDRSGTHIIVFTSRSKPPLPF
jgi:transmembrane sensor